jgi:hypothetical protein
LEIARSAAGVIVVVTDPVLFTETGSVVPTGGATDAVLVNVPTVVAVPVAVIVTELPAPAFNSTSDNAPTFPTTDTPVPSTPV